MIERKTYLNKVLSYVDTEFVKVITGVRRSGKSFLLLMLRNHLEQENKQVFYLNFEHPDNFPLNNADALYTFIKERVKTNKKIYFIFDEIGEVTGWQKLINGLRVAYDCDIYLSGSNANLLSGELATYLSGRYVQITVFPLSFSEFLNFSDKRIEEDILLRNFLLYGGFPSVALSRDEEMKKDVLKGIYNSILLKDVSLRGNITNIDVLLKLSLYLLDNIGNSISSTKIADYFKAQNQKIKPETINKYLLLLENAFIFYKVNRYDLRGKERLKTLGKYYVVDLGLKNAMLSRSNTNLGYAVENVVFLKLVQSGYQVFVGKYDSQEIDFVCFKEDDIKYVQVILSMPENSRRESDNLLNIRDNYDRLIITYDYKDVGIVDGIPIVHLKDFLKDSF